MFELVFLGTGASAPSIDRNLPSSLVTHEGSRFLIDCGEGTQRQLLRSGVGFRGFSKIFLTHGHLDHILGLGGLVSTFRRWKICPRLEIYGGRSALARVQALMRVVQREESSSPEIEYIEVTPGTIMIDDKLQITAFRVRHRGGGCFGYSFCEREKRPFLVEEAERLGVPEGPERSKLVRGESVALADGTIAHPYQVLGEPIRGTKLVYVGDAGRIDGLVEAAKSADALVIEATYTSIHRGLAARFDHLTAAQAAQVAQEAGVKRLFLNHISRRYHDEAILVEARAIFPNTVIARDLDRFRITKT